MKFLILMALFTSQIAMAQTAQIKAHDVDNKKVAVVKTIITDESGENEENYSFPPCTK